MFAPLHVFKIDISKGKKRHLPETQRERKMHYEAYINSFPRKYSLSV